MAIILRPKHIDGLWIRRGGVYEPQERTKELYRQQQRIYCAMNLACMDPAEIHEPQVAYIGLGCWRITCRCKEAPHCDPEWNLSCCFGCGLFYTNIIFPADYQAIEDVLSMRRVKAERSWLPHETAAWLVIEQEEHLEMIPDHVANREDVLLEKEISALQVEALRSDT